MPPTRTIVQASLLWSFAAGAQAQAALDVEALIELDDVEVSTVDGTEVGEVEEVLIDPAGNVVAVVVETESFLGLGDEDVVFALSELTFKGGKYVTALTETEIESLPRYD